ncbi:sulfate adenylyltransferase subunit 1 [Commensalibacter nepenthis]|uniref:sulfate adenylyltransferase n=1 Tax=Commensalibacter nepenthis TaxID=3043872 RepID=A0ABT6Q941_9PROT|nr:GTP-binding protein [Commensalibacter sp. TBRC 10068]MDI2112758.1 GTP-binding protein [Commensalibacter sp. TBRC 10068]
MSSLQNKHTLKFLTAGSVDDGKSTLIGRLLLDSKAILADQLSGIQHKLADDESYDLAKLTDGLQAEREQGITIDVAYRYFTTPERKFIIADAPGHEQYTRNMVTAASSSDAAVILVDVTKINWEDKVVNLLPQTRRHTLLANLLKVPSILFAINKLDAIKDPDTAFINVKRTLEKFTQQANITITNIIPISALKGLNITARNADKHGNILCEKVYQGPSLLEALTALPSHVASDTQAFHFPVQFVQKLQEAHDGSSTQHGRRIFWGRIAAGGVKIGDELIVQPSGAKAKISKIFANALQGELQRASTGQSVGLILDQEIDVSRGDWLLAPSSPSAQKEAKATLAWLDDEPLVVGRAYWLKHGHRWIKTKIASINHHLNIHTLETEPAENLDKNSIGEVSLILQQPIPVLPYHDAKDVGAAILVDTATNRTAGAVLFK